MSKFIIYTLLSFALIAVGFMGYNFATAPLESDAYDLKPIDVSVEPIQTVTTGDSIPDLIRGNKTVFFTPLARYHIAGLIVSKHKYSGKFMNHLSPCDFALVWGTVPEQLQYIKFQQMVRYCMFNYKSNAPIDPQYVANHMSNNHLIPANTNIRRAIRLAKKGMKVELDGYLVNLHVNKGSSVFSTWGSSLVRTDSGGGACELIYLTKLRIGDKVYE